MRELVVTVPHGRSRSIVAKLTVSIGGAHYPITTAQADEPNPAETTVDELLRAADSACYQAKQDGRDRVKLTPDTLREHQLPIGAEEDAS